MAFNWAYNTRDFKFILKEWLPTERIFAYDRFKDYYSKEDVHMVIDPVFKIAKEIVAPSNEDGEARPARFENGQVILPESFAKVYRYVQENGFGSSKIDETAEGVLPEVLYAAVQEMFASANPAWAPYIELTTGAAGLIQTFGDEKLKEMFLPKMFAGEWSGTMCLTEPTAGSDVGDILSKAYPTDHPRIFKIKGSKIFITGAEHKMSDNIINLYLGRVDGARPGTKGISLFVVPKYWINEDGSMEDNDIQCLGIEHKMGMKGSATTALSIGENNNCRGWLLGSDPRENDGKGDGMAQMFQMMNEARAGTGHLAQSVMANAYYNAAQYAKDRIQGRQLTDPKGERVTIINHEDIKRMLLNAKAHTEAMRAMIFQTYFYFDVRHHDPDKAEREKASDYIEILTPIIKAYCSDEAWSIIGDCIQVYGGYGYCVDYPVEQSARDVKVLSIWEGTNFIQSLDLIGRKWLLKKGAAFAAWLQDIQDFIEENKNATGFKDEFANLERALSSYRQLQMTMGGYFGNKQYGMMPLFARRILTVTAQLYCGMMVLSQAILAEKKIQEIGPAHFDHDFYQGKKSAARYYLMNVVPNVWATAELVKFGDNSVLDVPVGAFDF